MTDLTFRSDMTVKPVAQMGGDELVLAAMLVSTQAEGSMALLDQDPEGSIGRIRFLMRNRHGTPFEHSALSLFVEAPIFVFREWHRHRIGMSYNEVSGRYTQLAPVFYVPGPDRPLVQVSKPGAYEYVPGDSDDYAWLVEDMEAQARHQYHSYQQRLNRGIAKEVARMSLGVNVYSAMYCTVNPRSLMAFLSLRTNRPDAVFPSKPMWEIAECAEIAETILAEHWPLTYSAFNEFGRVCP